MQKHTEITNVLYLVKSAVKLPGVATIPFLDKVTKPFGTAFDFTKKQWRKIPGVARYGIGTAATVGFPAMSYMAGKSEAEDHVANKAYTDSYNLAQERIGREWGNMPAWQRYAASTLGIRNSMALKDWMGSNSKTPLQYSNTDFTGNTTYY